MVSTSRTEKHGKLQMIGGSSPSSQTDHEAETSHSPKDARPAPERKVGPGPGRKPKACLACKRLKMKCEIFPGDRKCRHCLRRKVDCIIKRTYMAQADGEDTREESSLGYGEKIDAMREEIKQMRQSLDAVLVKSKDNSEAEKTLDDAQKTKRGDTDSVFSSRVTPRTLSPMNSTSARLNPARRIGGRDTNTRLALTREDSPSPASDYDQRYGPETLEEPMGSLYEVTRLRNIRSNQANTPPSVSTDNIKLNDFISRGVVSEEKAEDLYNTFHKTLNHYLWVGLEQVHPSWTSVRKSSELLAATILTVTALHLPMSSDVFDACYNEFLSLVSSSMFSRYHSVDDVRGLCISAFWLSEHSWKLTGHAIRIATELGIHQSFPYALEGDREHFLRARLWYMLYVCDRHFSIAYGRPPSVGETTQIREYELFLSSHLSSVLDTRILSQVSLMQILTQVYERFSERPLPTMESVRAAGFGKAQSTTAPDSRVERPSAMLSDSDFDTLRSFSVEVDHWRMRWYPRQPPSPFIGQFTSKGVILYSYFAKLQINALAIRGVSINSDKLSTERKEFANMAISAALSILTLVQEEDDLRKALVGTPLYVHTMIAFASVFLMKVASRWDGIMGLNIEYANVSRLLEKMVIVLKEAVTSERHMLKHIGQGLEKMLGRMREARKQDTNRQVSAHGSSGAGASPDPFAWHITSGSQAGIEDETVEGLQNSKSTRTIFEGTHSTTQVWDPSSYPGQQSNAESELGMFGDNLTGMNETFMYEAFGTGSAGDVYNMLSSQFQY